jgi:hypothetical protein
VIAGAALPFISVFCQSCWAGVAELLTSLCATREKRRGKRAGVLRFVSARQVLGEKQAGGPN